MNSLDLLRISIAHSGPNNLTTKLDLRLGLFTFSQAQGYAGVKNGSYELIKMIYSVSQKNPPYGFLKLFPKRLEFFNQFFTHLLHDHFYTRVQIFCSNISNFDKVMPY